MSTITLKPLNDGEEVVVIPLGTTTIGRGSLLGCSDKNVSRNHALLEVTSKGEVFLTPTHVNPCFYQPTAITPGQILKKDVPLKLENGDTFSLLPWTYKYQVCVGDMKPSSEQTLKPKNCVKMAANLTAVNTCNVCKSYVVARWHCPDCDDFDLCVNCYTKDEHVHEMQEIGFELEEDKKQTGPQDSRHLIIRRCTVLLEHASKCGNANCCLTGCRKMKGLRSHSKTCKQKGRCALCKQHIALASYHAKECQDEKCPVLFCLSIKLKLAQSRMAQKPPPATTILCQKMRLLMNPPQNQLIPRIEIASVTGGFRN